MTDDVEGADRATEEVTSPLNPGDYLLIPKDETSAPSSLWGVFWRTVRDGRGTVARSVEGALIAKDRLLRVLEG